MTTVPAGGGCDAPGLVVPRAGARPSVEEQIRARAEALGFDCFGIAAALPPPLDDHRRYAAFIAEGRAASMRYLVDGLAARARVDGPEILEGAQSVICVARSAHRTSADCASDEGLAPLIARYARGRDYHLVLRRKLSALAQFVRTMEPGTRARPLCDTAPVLERAWAARAGIGFIGKNAMLVSPSHGTELLLGEIVTSLRLEPGRPIAAQCDDCTRCLDGCPTGALVAPWTLDARRCVAYLTIEHRGPIAEALHHGAGSSLFGCDRCQRCCPFNGADCAPARDAGPFRPLRVWSELRLPMLAELTHELWRERTVGSPLRRLEVAAVARNALLVAARQLGESAARGSVNRAEAEATLAAGRVAHLPATAELAASLWAAF